jgi:hypothetical protein
MSEIIFAEPRTFYGSYEDLRSLIRLSNFKTCYIDEIDPQSDNAYIITIRNGEIGDGWADAKAKIVLYDLEWRRAPEAPIPGVAEVWMCDKWQAELTGSRYVPVGGHAGLRQSIQVHPEPPYDVAYLAYMTYRRQVIHAELQARGVKLTPTSAWGEERDRLLNASRVYLHVHQHDDIPAVPGLRLVVAAAYGLPVVTEECADYGVFRSFLIHEPIAALPDFVEWLLGVEQFHWSAYARLGAALHHFLCVEHTFRKGVEAAL